VRDTRDHLLALPDRLAEAVAVETNPAEVRNILKREIRETLLDLSTALTKPHGDRLRSEGKLGSRLARGLRRRRQQRENQGSYRHGGVRRRG
jgi:hypothetical protein